MTHDEKLRAMDRHLPGLGIPAAMYAPPLYKLFWKLGWKIASPVMAGTLHLAVMGFVSIVLLMALLGWLVPLPFEAKIQREYGFWVVPVACGLLGALLAPWTIRRQYARHRLPAWDDYRGE